MKVFAYFSAHNWTLPLDVEQIYSVTKKYESSFSEIQIAVVITLDCFKDIIYIKCF